MGKRRNASTDYETFVSQCAPALLRTAHLLSGDHHHAEDLLQTALTTVYLRWEELRDTGAAEAYTRRVLASTYVSWWRRKSWHERPVAELPRTSVAHEPDVHDHELWAQLRGLPRQQRAVLVLRFYEDLSVEETAAALGVSTGTVKSHTSRALEAMRSRLAPQTAPTQVESSAPAQAPAKSLGPEAPSFSG